MREKTEEVESNEEHEPFACFRGLLPKAVVPWPNVTVRVAQGDHHQIGFLEAQAGLVVPVDRHGAQWGVVLAGEMVLKVDGEYRTYRKGDHYHIPADIPHGAYFPTRFLSIEAFDDYARYRVQKR